MHRSVHGSDRDHLRHLHFDHVALRPTGSSTLSGARPITTAGAGIPLNYELRLYEGQTRFDVIYGSVPQGNTSATAGVQKTTPPLTSTSAMARAVRLLADKATS